MNKNYSLKNFLTFHDVVHEIEMLSALKKNVKVLTSTWYQGR